MENLSLTETETRYFGDIFLCCDVDKAGKIPILRATELFRSAGLSNDVIRQIVLLSGIPQTALHVSRSQFYSCLKLIAAYQASIPLRPEILSLSTINLPLPRFSWKDSPPLLSRSIGDTNVSNDNCGGGNSISSVATSNSSVLSTITNDANGLIATTATATIDSTNITPSSSHHSYAHYHRQRHHESNSQKREWCEIKSPNLIELTNNTSEVPQDINNSDLQSTDSEVEPNESNNGRENPRNRVGSPEAWSTNSDSPTPTNSVTERPWIKDHLWQGILGGDEHRQLLGTEEESSDRHSSDEDNDTNLEPLYQITPEQREYYHKQFKAVQPDPHGLLSGHVARVFFEKSRIPIEELRHIWQLCDVTKDGALSLAEFTAAMHLVVLRRNNIPLPSVLPSCLHSTVLTQQQHQVVHHHQPVDPPEADLLHLGDDDKPDSSIPPITSIPLPPPSLTSTIQTSATTTTVISNTNNQIKDNNSSDYKRVVYAHHHSDNKNMNLSSLSNASQTQASGKQQHMKVSSSPISGCTHQSKHRSVSNSPPSTAAGKPATPNHKTKELSKDWNIQNREWTKFTESPTSKVSSPGPKPVNFDMQRTAQAVVSDPQILHPVPLRVTPVGTEAAEDEHLSRLQKRSETLAYDNNTGLLGENESSSPKQQQSHLQQQHPHHPPSSSLSSSQQQQHRESLQSGSIDLRAIQRPQPKKFPTKNIGAIPPPPQRESSFGSIGVGGNDTVEILPFTGGTSNLFLTRKTEAPPLPPPRPHRHARSSSLDLNKLKMGTPSQPEIATQNSFEVQMDFTNSGFADFAHFSENAIRSVPTEQTSTSFIQNIETTNTPLSVTSVRPIIPSQRVSAFEVYRKPNVTSCSSQSPEQQLSYQHQLQPPAVQHNPSSSSTGSISSGGVAELEKRLTAISETFRHISFKQDKNMTDILGHLRDQNVLLLRLCNDLSEELLTVQQKKGQIRSKLEGGSNADAIHSNI